MATEKIFGKTPNGGDYSEAFYIDDRGNSVEPDKATKIIIHEYTKDGALIRETVCLIKNN